jgi:hypothetical protein
MSSVSNYALRMPFSLKRSVETVAREDGTTMNQFIVSAVAEKLAAMKTADFFTQRAGRGDMARAVAFLNRSTPGSPQAGDELPG